MDEFSGTVSIRIDLHRAQIDGAGASSTTELPEYAVLRDGSREIREIFLRIHHREVPTIYPPVAQAFFAVCAAVTPASAPIWLHLSVLRVLLILVDIAILFSMRGLLRQVGMSYAWCLAYGWCPLAIKEVANSAHIDNLAVLFTLVMLQLLLRAGRASSAGQQSQLTWSMAAACLGLAVLSKSYPIILLPLMASFAFAKIGVRALVPVVICAAVVTAGYLPCLELSKTPDRATGQSSISSPAVDGHSPWRGLGTYLTRWQMNDLVFMVVHENLREPIEESNHWFVVVPVARRREINQHVDSFIAGFGFTGNVDPAFVATQVLMGTALMGLLAWCAWQTYWKPAPLVLLRSSFLVLAWGWLLSSAAEPVVRLVVSSADAVCTLPQLVSRALYGAHLLPSVLARLSGPVDSYDGRMRGVRLRLGLGRTRFGTGSTGRRIVASSPSVLIGMACYCISTISLIVVGRGRRSSYSGGFEIPCQCCQFLAAHLAYRSTSHWTNGYHFPQAQDNPRLRRPDC